MELDSKNLLTVQVEQQDHEEAAEPEQLERSDDIDLLTESQSKMTKAVIIYDTDSQEHVLKVITSSESKIDSEFNDASIDPDNLITLHASPPVKDAISEEDTSANNQVTIKREVFNMTYETEEEPAIDSTVEAAIEPAVEPALEPAIETKFEEKAESSAELFAEAEAEAEDANADAAEDPETDDDETIATFVTSTGQQLALYAVEDSDEIFAVAVYDESGEPPSNFHFLMKADVERLIGEGAVKTVKKPSVQPSKQPETPEKKEESKYEKVQEIKPKPGKVEVPIIEKTLQIKTEIVEVPMPQKIQAQQQNKIQKVEPTKNVVTKSYTVNNRNINATKSQTPPAKTVAKTTKVVSNVTQCKVENKNESNIAYVVTNDNESYVIEHAQEDLDSDSEIIEQSTVQFILCDGDVSDSELTFDEVQASLRNFKTRKSTCSANKPKPSQPQKVEMKKVPSVRFSPTLKSTPKVAPILSPRREPSATGPRTYKNVKKARLTNNLLQATRKIKQEIIDPSYGDVSSFEDGQTSADETTKNLSKEDSPIEILQNAVKVKRSRKQQLTVVNRTDSEIIIQPASVFSEEEREHVATKKKGRKKKKIVSDPDYNPRKPVRKPRKSTNRLVEVIEIDVDESERTNIEAGVEGIKGKGSSDKENDVISVDDSDEDEEVSKTKATKSVMKCNHCMRNFRKRGALERHLQACSKANLPRKRFKCKLCEETFDIAVALARHVRVTHSPRKRGRPPKGWVREDDDSDEETPESEESLEESEPEPEPIGPKRRGRPPRKSSVSKDESFSPIADTAEKPDNTGELSTEPRRRGRPPKKSIPRERSVSSNFEEKNESISEQTTEPRRRGRPRKSSLSKEDKEEKERSLSPDIEDKTENAKPIAQIPKKRGRPPVKKNLSETEEKDESTTETSWESRKRGRPSKRSLSKDERSISPDAEKPTEHHETSEESSLVLELEDTPDEEKRPIMEPPKKRKLSRDIESSTTPDVEDKTSTETEFRKRGRPPKSSKDDVVAAVELEEKTDAATEPWKKRRVSRDIAKNERPISPELDKKSEAADESSTSPRKKGRPSEDDELVEKSESAVVEPAVEPQKDNESIKNTESNVEFSPSPRKRGRPVKDKAAKDDRPETSEAEEKDDDVLESTTEDDSGIEPRKRGRPAKDRSSKDDDRPTTPEPETSAIEISPEPRKRGRPAKDRSSKDDDRPTTPEPETSAIETSPEPRKRGRPPKDKPSSFSKDSESDDKVESTSKTETSPKPGKPGQKKFSPRQAWKVKKLNCADCGKWCSSGAELATHRLQHRTKKSGHRCRLCKRLVPSELYERHLATHHHYNKSTIRQRGHHKRTLRSSN